MLIEEFVATVTLDDRDRNGIDHLVGGEAASAVRALAAALYAGAVLNGTGIKNSGIGEIANGALHFFAVVTFFLGGFRTQVRIMMYNYNTFILKSKGVWKILWNKEDPRQAAVGDLLGFRLSLVGLFGEDRADLLAEAVECGDTHPCKKLEGKRPHAARKEDDKKVS